MFNVASRPPLGRPVSAPRRRGAALHRPGTRAELSAAKQPSQRTAPITAGTHSVALSWPACRETIPSRQHARQRDYLNVTVE